MSQAIYQPFGISVFGSAIIRVEPDVASLYFAVSRLEQEPKDAFQKAREGALSVQAFLRQANIDDVGSSRVQLAEEFHYGGSEKRFAGYRASISFHVLLRELDRMEEILAGVINAGANSIRSIDLQTSRLKEVRAEARQRAVEAAREKAELYCKTAGVNLGAVIHIEDANPDLLHRQEGHRISEIKPDDEGPLNAFEPGSIVVGGAVFVAFQIES